MKSDYILLPVSSLEPVGENINITLGDDAVVMCAWNRELFSAENGIKIRAHKLKVGDKIFVKLFEGIDRPESQLTDKDIRMLERLVTSRRKYHKEQLPNSVLNN